MKKILACLLAAIMSVTAFVGCTGKSDEPSLPEDKAIQKEETSSKVKDEAPRKIKMFRIGTQQDPKKDRILQALQKATNTEIEFVTVPWDQGETKINLMMSSKEQLDLIVYDFNANAFSWAKDGALYSYDELIKDDKYPLIKSVINSDIYKGLKIDGKAYYKPLPLCLQQWGWIIRTDWLENVGLPKPTTLEELHTVAKAFTEKDPDKNGINDTTAFYLTYGGVTGTPGISLLDSAYETNGSGWLEQEDKSLINWTESENFKLSKQEFGKYIKEGLVNKDWLSVKQDPAQSTLSEKFAAGKYGIATTSIPDVFAEKLKAQNPNSKTEFLAPLKTFTGKEPQSYGGGGYWWGHMIPKTCSNPTAVLDLLEFSLTKEGRELTHFGIEGIHYSNKEEKDGKVIYDVVNAECDKDWNTKSDGYLYPLTWGGFNNFEYAYIPIAENNYDFMKAFKNFVPIQPRTMSQGQYSSWQAMNSKYAVAGPLINIMDEDMIKNKKKLDDIVNSKAPNIIVRSKNFDKDWAAMVAEWKKAGGDELTARANELQKQVK